MQTDLHLSNISLTWLDFNFPQTKQIKKTDMWKYVIEVSWSSQPMSSYTQALQKRPINGSTIWLTDYAAIFCPCPRCLWHRLNCNRLDAVVESTSRYVQGEWGLGGGEMERCRRTRGIRRWEGGKGFNWGNEGEGFIFWPHPSSGLSGGNNAWHCRRLLVLMLVLVLLLRWVICRLESM